MEIIKEWPPNIEAIKLVFPFDLSDCCFCYGDTIFNPSGVALREDIIAHEKVHSNQQKNFEGGISSWWDLYLSDSEFRLSQELEAYKAQFLHFCTRFRDRNRRTRCLFALATDLSSETYGNIIGETEAIRLIKGDVKGLFI